MPSFIPPIQDGVAWAKDISADDIQNALMSYYGSVPTGASVVRDQSGTVTTSQYPYLGGATHVTFNGATVTTTPDAPGLLDAQNVYLGGHIYDISNAEALVLAAAGFINNLNIADVTVTWDPTDLTHLSDINISASPGDVPAAPSIVSSQRGFFKLASGAPVQSAGKRDWWVHDSILYQNIEAETILDPVEYFGSYGAAPQGGLVLRVIQSGGKYSGITINNNIFFIVPVINVGVWQANLDGTGFTNRQYGFPVDSLLTPNFPQKLGVRLTGNVVQVRISRPDQPLPPWSNDLTSDLHSKAINLDTDAGDSVAIPTPTGKGQAGFIGAHLGTDDRAGYRFRRTVFKNRDVT